MRNVQPMRTLCASYVHPMCILCVSYMHPMRPTRPLRSYAHPIVQPMRNPPNLTEILCVLCALCAPMRSYAHPMLHPTHPTHVSDCVGFY